MILSIFIGFNAIIYIIICFNAIFYIIIVFNAIVYSYMPDLGMEAEVSKVRARVALTFPSPLALR